MLQRNMSEINVYLSSIFNYYQRNGIFCNQFWDFISNYFKDIIKRHWCIKYTEESKFPWRQGNNGGRNWVQGDIQYEQLSNSHSLLNCFDVRISDKVFLRQ